MNLDNAVVAHESTCLGRDFSFMEEIEGSWAALIFCASFFHVTWILWFPFK